MNSKDKPLSERERERLADEAMRITQSREDLLRRNDALLKQMMQCPSRYPPRKAKRKHAAL